MAKTTLSVIKADVGSIAGHTVVHPALEQAAIKIMDEAKEKGTLMDFWVTHCGDDLELIMSHTKGVDNKDVHTAAWTAFETATKVAEELKLYGAGQDMLETAFSGNVKGMGPGIAEMEFTERKAEPLGVFMMDKTEPGAFNFPVFKIFADPFNTAGLVVDPNAHDGFVFEVWDIHDHKRVMMSCPEEMYDLLAMIGAKSRYVIKRVFPKKGVLPEDEPVAAVSTEKLAFIAGEYVGKDDPAAIIRSQS
ncbi:MAG: fructose 1,6-bisphosphatase, partial [Methanobacteriota archaeon]